MVPLGSTLPTAQHWGSGRATTICWLNRSDLSIIDGTGTAIARLPSGKMFERYKENSPMKLTWSLTTCALLVASLSSPARADLLDDALSEAKKTGKPVLAVAGSKT